MNKPIYRSPAAPSQAEAFRRVMQEEHERKTRGVYRAANWIVFLALAAAFLPFGLGAIMWFLGGGVALLLCILAVVMLIRGAVGRGLITLLFALVILPVLLFVAPLISVGLWGNLADKVEAQAVDPQTADVARVNPDKPLVPDLKEVFDQFKREWRVEPATDVKAGEITFTPFMTYGQQSVNRARWSFIIFRHAEDWLWLRHHALAVLIDGQPVPVKMDFDSDTIRGGGVQESVFLDVDEVLWVKLATADTVQLRVGATEFDLPKETQRQMGLIYNRWLNSQP